MNYINKQISSKNKIIIGDAPGIDSQVQRYLSSKGYNNVEVYTSEKGKPRHYYNNGLNWKVNNVDTKNLAIGSKEYLAAKDIAMQKAADMGLAVVIENGGSKATRKNVDALLRANKDISVVELKARQFK